MYTYSHIKISAKFWRMGLFQISFLLHIFHVRAVNKTDVMCVVSLWEERPHRSPHQLMFHQQEAP